MASANHAGAATRTGCRRRVRVHVARGACAARPLLSRDSNAHHVPALHGFSIARDDAGGFSRVHYPRVVHHRICVLNTIPVSSKSLRDQALPRKGVLMNINKRALWLATGIATGVAIAGGIASGTSSVEPGVITACAGTQQNAPLRVSGPGGTCPAGQEAVRWNAQGRVGAQGPRGKAAKPLVGPQGPAGPTGATGPAGPAGPAGAAGSVGPAGATGPSAMINTGGWISVAEASPAATTTVTTFGDVTISLSCQAQSGYTDIKVRGIATGTGAGFGSSSMSGWTWQAFTQNTERDIYGQSPGGSAVETRALLYSVLASDGQTRLLSGFLRLDRTVSPAICKISLGA